MDENDVSRTNVFVSYSRRDDGFAQDLILSLESYGFGVFIDRQDLMPGEAWEPRLASLIHGADTIAVILTPNWLSSDQCEKELGIALDQGKRVIPLVATPIDLAGVPEPIRRLQFIHFHGEGRSYARGAAELAEALRTDLAWVRDHTRLADLAREWSGGGKPDAVLLRGPVLENALAWIARKPPPSQMSIQPVVVEFIEASRRKIEDDDRARLRAQVRRVFAVAVGLILIGVLGGVVYFLVQDRVRQELAFAQTTERSEALRVEIVRLNTEVRRLTEQIDALLAGVGQPRGVEDVPQSAAPTPDQLLAPQLSNLTSDDTLLRRGARDDLAFLIGEYNDPSLNQGLIEDLAAQTGRDAYRRQLGMAVALDLQPGVVPLTDRDEAVRLLEGLRSRTTDATLQRSLDGAIETVRRE